MKTLLCNLALSLFTINPCMGQLLEEKEQKSPQELYDFHTDKRKTNLAVGWTSLVGGLGLIALGASTNLNKCLLSDCNDGMPLVYAGIGFGLSSIIWFESARKHKDKAKLQLGRGAVGLTRRVNYSYVSITIPL